MALNRAMQLGQVVLRSSDPAAKVAAVQQAHSALVSGDPFGTLDPTAIQLLEGEPMRPDTPSLVPSREMPGHKQLGVPLNLYLVHALAHIELNAMDIYWDTILRFAGTT